MKFSLIRADDQVHLEVETFNLEPQRAGAGYELRPVTTGQPGHISVAFPKQHVMEYVGTPALPFPKQIGPIFSAATTRVVFLVPPGTAAIPFTVAGILGALPALPLVTDGSAGTVGLAQGQPEPRAASTAELVLDAMGGSPNGAAGGAPGRTLGAAEAAVAGAARSAPASDGAAQNGAPGGALLAELRARARARRRAPEAEPALAPAASGGPSGPVSLAPARGPVEPAPADLPAAAAAAAGAPGVTAMGFPSRLYLNVPGGETRMAHAASPVADAGNVELWHSRLSRRAANGRLVEVPANVTALRALVQQPTADPALSDATINSVLDTNAQTAISNQTTLSPKIPATARRLWLSPLGAWLDAHGSWPGHSVQGWRHRMVMGRDHYVQVVQKGRLYPLGHEAVLVSTMERTSPSRNGWVSTLVRRDTIRVTQAERDFGAPADPAGRQWPWQTVELLTLESPAGLKKTVFTDVATKKEVSYLEVGGLPFRFDCQAEDRGHRVATFDLPLLFVPDGLTNLAGVASWFAGAEAQGLGFRGLDLDGQAVALAPPTGGATPPDTTTVVAHSAPLVVSPGGPLGFRPSMPNVQGIVPALARFSPEGGLPRTVSLAPSYLSHGFDPANNPGEALFAFAGGTFNVQNWLSGALDSFKLFGVFKLTDLIPAGLSLGKEAPRMVSQALDGLSTQEMKWDVPLFRGLPKEALRYSTPLGVATLRRSSQPPPPGNSGEARMLVHVQAQVVPGTTQVRSSALCQLTNLELALELAGEEIVVLPLPLFEFKSVDGGKPDVNARMGRITFGGVLRFVETLAALVDQEGLSDPPAIEQIPNGVRSSFYAPIPGAAVGMFSLENITFGAVLTLTFGSPLALALSFSSKDSPFQCTVAALGGGGWLEVVLTTNGLQSLMGSLQFGAALSVTLGVARGSVSVMGGIEFFIEGSVARLTGYLRVRGEVQVLGLISVCIESTLALTYNSDNGKLEGSCEWVLRVKVVFIRKTVRVRFEKRFAGANGDPTFAELMAPAGTAGELPWDQYCGAFAEA